MLIPNCYKLDMRFFILIILVAFWAPSSFALCVKVSKANLRSGPGTKYRTTWVVGRYMPLLKVKSRGGWYQVRDLDGDVHWVHSRLVTKDYRCVVVKVKISSLRTRPSKQAAFAQLPQVDKYTPFKRLEWAGEWMKIQDELGYQYWVHQNNVWRPLKINRISL